MKLIQTTSLTDQQKKEVQVLVDACKNAEPITLSAPFEDGLDYILLYEENTAEHGLLAFGFLFFVPQEDAPDTVTCEFTAFVHPKFRRKGHFSTILNTAISIVEHYESAHNYQVDFCFLTDEKSPAAGAVLDAIGAEYWYSEYKMVRSPKDTDVCYISTVQVALLDSDGNPLPDGSDVNLSKGASYLCSASLDGKTIGSCALLMSSEETYLYAFQIAEEFQSQGHGKDFLRGVLALLTRTELPVSVQVSGLNYIARNLYKKTGFRNTESLSYYIY